VVTTLLESCGGSLEIRAPEAGGAHVRIIVPARPLPAGPILGGSGQVAP
jgi:hypothetical protein